MQMQFPFNNVTAVVLQRWQKTTEQHSNKVDYGEAK